MGSATDMVVGVVTEVGGILKENVGWALGSQRMQAEGLCRQIEGKVQRRYGTNRLAAVADQTVSKANALH